MVPSSKGIFNHLSLGTKLGGTDSQYHQRTKFSKGFVTTHTPVLHASEMSEVKQAALKDCFCSSN